MFFSRSKKRKDRLVFSMKKTKHNSSKTKANDNEKDEELETTIFHSRIYICVGISILMVIVLFCNLYYLQIISYRDYQTRSNENRIKVIPVVPPRGIIYDRNHVVLAENSPVYHLVLFPNKQVNTEITIRNLNELLSLSLSEKDIKRLLYESKTRKRFSGVEVSNFLTEEQIATFAVNSYKYPNAQVVANLKRAYPFADITTHTTGYVSRINQNDVKNLEEAGKLKNYEGSTEIGKLGIEKYYEDYLHGTTGSSKVEVNSHGQVVRTLNYIPPEAGRDLT